MAENTSAAPAGTQGAGGYVAPPQEDKSWIGVVFGLVAVAVAATGPLWHEKVYGERDGAALRQLRSEVSALEGRLAAATAVEAQVAQLAARLEQIQVPAMLVAASDLRSAMQQGESFAAQLSLFRTVVGDAGAAAAIAAAAEPFADSGVPTLADLGGSFGMVSQEALVAAYPDSQTDNMSYALAQVKTVASRISTMVVGVEGTEGPAATVARARLALSEGDLAAAIEQMATLPEPSQTESVVAWLADARARLEVDAAIEQLDRMIAERSASGLKN